MNNEIEKTNPDDVLAAITSFNDPSIIINIFKELGWTYTFEIKEWLAMARQNANLAVKSKALIQLRKLLREAAETGGYTANVSQTVPNAQGGHTTFHAKRLANMLNPTKQIESNIKESENDKIEETRTEPNRGSDRRQNKDDEGCSKDSGLETIPEVRGYSGRADPERDVDSGGTEPSDGGETTGAVSGDSNPCIKTRPPSTDSGDLFPGISSAEEG